MRIQVLLVAEWEIDKAGFRFILGSSNKTEVIGEASNDLGMVVAAIGCDPDAVVICIRKDEFVDADIIRSIKHELPTTKIVIVSADPSFDQILSYLTIGVDAYWLKNIPQDLLVPALQSLCLDMPRLTPALAAFVFRLAESQFPCVASLSSNGWRALRRRRKQNLQTNVPYGLASSFR